MDVSQNRVSKGVPTGGEFAVGVKGENPDLPAEGNALPWAPDRRLGEPITARRPIQAPAKPTRTETSNPPSE